MILGNLCKMAAPCRNLMGTIALRSPGQVWQYNGALLRWHHRSAPMLSAAEPGKSAPEGPEYIPKRKAHNPMMKVGLAWIIGLPSGIIGFLLAKREVDKNRLKQLKVRQRMKKANEGIYERERYNTLPKTE